jgi:Type II CAAX prenyl endopeptidase Rce1-like
MSEVWPVFDQQHNSMQVLPQRRLLRYEVALVLGLSLLPSALYAIVSLLANPIRGQSVELTGAVLRWPDAASELISIGSGLVPVLLIGYLLTRANEIWADIGIDRSQPLRDTVVGILIAAAIGGSGLGLYLLAVRHGWSRAVIPVADGGRWWQIPLLLLSALRFGILEEVVVVGYLTRRLTQLGLGGWPTTILSALFRGSYHLYQGYGAFVGNFVMGLLFARWRLSGRRTVPLVIAHTIIDSVTFVGWLLLHKRLHWLPH